MKRFLPILLLLLCESLLAQSRISVQWTTATPRGFVSVTDWASLPNKPYMTGVVDEQPGWVAAMRVDGKIIYGCDHYAIVSDEQQKHITSYCWTDGVGNSFGIGARVCTYDPFHCNYYGHLGIYSQDELDHPPTIELPADQFHPPADKYIRHGKYVSNWNEFKKLW